MKTSFFLCLFLFLEAYSSAVKEKPRFMLMITEKGNLRVENLNRPPSSRTKAVITDVTFYLYTINNPLEGEKIVADDFEGLVASSLYDPARKNVILIHGWTGDYLSSMAVNATAALLGKFDLNVFSVDWSGPASLFYSDSVREVPSVGGFIGDFIQQMIDHYGLSGADFLMAGHSLGAHVAGRAGAVLGGVVDTIVGLDPAHPLFSLEDTETRLDTTDTQFLQIIHTNGGLLGFPDSLGHSDYYPNGGEVQPGCGVDITGYCSHARSHEYFAESIASSGFVSVKCTTFEDYIAGLCAENDSSLLGEYPVDKTASGDYFLETDDAPPFALG